MVILLPKLFLLSYTPISGCKSMPSLLVYNVLCMYVSAPLSEARCSKGSDKGFLFVRHRSKAYIHVCIASKAASVLLLARQLTEP